jgi:hypothetical protein
VSSDGVEEPRDTKPADQSLQKRLARSAAPKPVCDDCAKQKQPDKHQDILPMAIAFQVGRLALGRLAQYGRHLTPSLARIRACSCYRRAYPGKNGEEKMGLRRSAIDLGGRVWTDVRPSFATESSTAKCGSPSQMSGHFLCCAVYARDLIAVDSSATSARESRSPRGAIGDHAPLE